MAIAKRTSKFIASFYAGEETPFDKACLEHSRKAQDKLLVSCPN